MPYSMTGFAAAEIDVDRHRLVWELRSVNHRYLDVGFRLPEDLRPLEPELRKQLGEGIRRGKVDCTFRLTAAEDGSAGSHVNKDEINRLRGLEKSVLAAAPDAAPLTVFEILRWPGVIRDESAAIDDLKPAVLDCFGQAIALLRDARAREGVRLAAMLTERLDSISELMQQIDGDLVTAAPKYRDRLLERLSKLDVEVEPERLEQELALIAQRVDVAEEADRLKAHVSEIRDVLRRDEPVGRRLDFLIQELNREANTLASKVQDEDLARRAVDLKVLVEQMREQVQNLE